MTMWLQLRRPGSTRQVDGWSLTESMVRHTLYVHHACAPICTCYYTRLFVWAMVGWVTLPFFSFSFLKASVLCTMSCTCISMYSTSRLPPGNLALSRAIGDFNFKSNPDLPQAEQIVTG